MTKLLRVFLANLIEASCLVFCLALLALLFYVGVHLLAALTSFGLSSGLLLILGICYVAVLGAVIGTIADYLANRWCSYD